MSNSDAARGDRPGVDAEHLRERAIEVETVTNDAVAGETVLPGTGPVDGSVDGSNEPTGGAEREVSPIYDEHDLRTQPEVDLGDEPDDEN